MRKLHVLSILSSGGLLVLGSCATSQQLIEFGRSQVVLAVSSLVGQIVTLAVQASA
ncbi:MAG: hypothetical protein HRU75_13725 [Planctomycetia bacterium]|nr:MAG: hypothetical protein HRU75_13725 [Planctomycetia bacterium]